MGGVVHTKLEADGRKAARLRGGFQVRTGHRRAEQRSEALLLWTAVIARGSAHGGYGEA